MKSLSIPICLILIIIFNVSTWIGHETAIEHTEEIVIRYFPLPRYPSRSREALVERYRAERIDSMRRFVPNYSTFDFQQSGLYNPSETSLGLQDSLDYSRFKRAHVEIYQEKVRSRMDTIFVGMKLVLALLLIGTLVIWIRTSPFSRFAAFSGINSLSRRSKLSMLEKEMNSLRRMNEQGLISAASLGRKVTELQEKAAKPLQ